MASRVTSVRHGRRPGKPCPTRARSLAMPSSVMRPCSVSAMGPPWTRRREGPQARPEQPDDRLFEEAALDGERARREKVVAPAGQPAERRGVGEVRADHAEERDAQVRDLLRLPAGVARRLAHHRDALAVERADPALEERLHRGRLLEQRALQQARQVRVARQVRGQPVERRVHALGPEAVLPRDHVDDRPETALEDGVVERLLAGEVVVEAGGGDLHLACQVAHRHAFHAARGEQALGGVEDELAGRGGGSAVTGPPLDGSAGHGGGVTNERSLRQGAMGYFRSTVSPHATGSALLRMPTPFPASKPAAYCPRKGTRPLAPRRWAARPRPYRMP